MLHALPPTYGTTRAALHALACFVVSPAYKAQEGRIGLRPFGEGFATPPFPDGSRVAVEGDRVGRVPGERTAITTLHAAAAQVGVELTADPGVGHDLPPFEPEAPLAVDAAASRALGAWYRLGQGALERLRAARPGDEIGEAQLWPEHFDLAVVVGLANGRAVNVGFSPGDGFSAEPYAYVGPHEPPPDGDPYWNVPFGALHGYGDIAAADDPAAAVDAFVAAGLDRLGL